MSSSSKKNRDGGKKPSVFERLGSKPSSVTEDYCKQWAHKGTCSYSNKCKFLETHNSKNFKPLTSSGKDGRKKSRSRSPPNRKDVTSNKSKAATKQSSKSADSGEWEKSLEHEDEMALERKLQMLQRELAKQEEQEHKGKAKKPTAKKRERSSSSSSTSSSSSSDTSSESSDSSSTSSVSSSSSSSSSSDSDGEVKEKKTKKKVRQATKRSQSSSSRNQGAKEKAKAKSRKIAKLSPVGQVARKKDSSSANKKQIRNNSPKRQHVPNTSVKHSRDSPTYSTMIHTRSPRIKDPEPLNRDRRQRRSPESSPTEAKRKLSTPVVRRRTDEHSPPRGRSRERKTTTSSSTYDVRGKVEKPRDRLLEPGYLVRPRSPVPVYREPYPVRDLSPTGSSYRERARAETYEPSRRVYSPQPILSKLERKEDLYDSRLRRPASPEPVRRPIIGRAKDYPDYDHDWSVVSEQTKIPDWDHPEFRRRNRPIEDISWSRTLSSTEMSWKKSYSPPPPLGNHSYPEQIHSNRNATWDPLLKSSSSRTDLSSVDNKRDRERRVAGDGRRSRDSNRRVPDPVVKPITPATRTEELRSPVTAESLVVAPKVEEIEETRPSSAVEVEAEENFSDFSDDVDEILNRDLQDTESVKTEEVVPVEPDIEPVKTPTEIELNVNVEPVIQVPDQDLQPSPKMVSPVVSAIESRSTDEDLLGGMDIEQISDEELEDEARSAPIDALEVDWTSLASKREKKVESGAARARQRWEGKAVLARLGITSREDQLPTSSNSTAERKPLFDCSSLFRRALSARMDLSFRRSLCNLPVRELVIEYCDDDLSLYKASVDLLLKDRVLAS